MLKFANGRLGKTILLVQHAPVCRAFRDEARLDGGRVRADGDPRRVVDAYLTAVEKTEAEQLATTTARAVAATQPAASPPVPEPTDAKPEGQLKDMFQAVEGRWGSQEIEITAVTLLDRDKQPAFVFHSGDPMAVHLKVTAHKPATDFVFGVSLFNADGVCCYGTNTFIEEMDPRSLSGDAEVTFAIDNLEPPKHLQARCRRSHM